MSYDRYSGEKHTSVKELRSTLEDHYEHGIIDTGRYNIISKLLDMKEELGLKDLSLVIKAGGYDSDTEQVYDWEIAIRGKVKKEF